MIYNEEDTDGRARVTADEERVIGLHVSEQISGCVGSQVGWLI